ncbi:histidine kinase dimerization/phosphoacceptor domain -containing protein [Pedobacter sp. BMA]|uniref:tetratricopeptide repeat-containing sensor histidine kinase n=1 Tax=Pedobacter sp. BMA TaxID=1663685 RepID=UPI000649CE70|nr:histidine kinase dimerization/phosphoacceptor domain -containing protein [Pedobacter sp. BMA]KLT64321.1 hypothetical protein AB669_17340 [Pedobacter sp. BMA]
MMIFNLFSVNAHLMQRFNKIRTCLALAGLMILSNNVTSATTPVSFSQRDTLQQLNARLSASNPDTNRVKCLLNLASYFIKQDVDKPASLAKASVSLHQALVLSRKIKSAESEYHTLMMYGRFYDAQHLRNKQTVVYERAIKLAKTIGNKHYEANGWYAYYVNIPDTVSDYRNKTFYNRAAMAYQLYKEVGSGFKEKYLEATLLRSMADFHLEEEKFDLAITELFEVIYLDKKHKLPDLPMAYDLLSAVYERKGELSNALNYALLSVKTAQANGEEVLDTYLNRVGSAYESMGKAKESIFWYSKTLYGSDKKDPYRFITAWAISNQLIKLGHPDRALTLLKKIWREVDNATTGHEYFMYLGFGECYTALKKYDLAKQYFNKLLARHELNDYYNTFQTSLFFSLSEFYFAQNKYQLALKFARMAKENQISMTLPRQIRLNEVLYKINLSMHNPAEAIIRLQTFHKLRDSMLSQDNLSTIERLQIEFQASQKENENELLRKKSQLQSQELNRIQLIKNVTIAGLAFLTLVLILIYGRFRLKKKLHDTLVKKKDEIDLAYGQLEVLVQQKNKLIEDKEGLLKEVHHRVKNNLQLTMSLLNSQSYYLEDLAAIEAIKESQHRLKSIALIHQKLYQTDTVATINIRPYVVELVEYLKESLTGSKKINFDIEMINLELDISKAVPLGLIINEAITNIFKYAFPLVQSGKIEITLKEINPDQYHLVIKDNGIGLPPDFDPGQSHTLGLTLMMGLATQIDGVFKMENNDGVLISLIFRNTSADLNALND